MVKVSNQVPNPTVLTLSCALLDYPVVRTISVLENVLDKTSEKQI